MSQDPKNGRRDKGADSAAGGAEENARKQPAHRVLLCRRPARTGAKRSALVRFRASGGLDLASRLFSWGDKLEILAPERLKAVMRQELEAALKRHGGGG